MPLKTEETEEPVLNLTPMLDVMMLLIIFFMVGTKFVDSSRQYDIELPTVTDARPLTSTPDELVVNIDRAGMIYVRDEEVDLVRLRDVLAEAKSNYGDQEVVIRGDGQGYYQNVMDVLNVCHVTEIKSIRLANQLESEAR